MGLQEDGVRAFGFWEPKTFQIRRGGMMNDQPVDRVYDWFDSEAFIRKLKAAGFNLYITHFSKGGGIEAEREERETTRRVIQRCRKHGLYVGGYIRYSTLVPDTMSVEMPDCIEKLCDLTGRGGHARYNTQYWRYMPCPTSPGYRDYLERLIRIGVGELGLDMLHVDGVVMRHEPDSCRCPRCQEQFRAWLRQRYPTAASRRRRFGYADYSHLELPDYGSGSEMVSPLPVLRDPLVQEWMLFHADLLAGIWAFIVGTARACNPCVAVQGNTSFYPSSNGMWFSGLDVVKLSEAGSFGFFSEETATDLTADGRIVGYFETLKKLRGLGHTTFCYNRDAVTHGPLTDPERAKRSVASQLAFNRDSAGVFLGEAKPGSVPLAPAAYLRFHQERRDLYAGTRQAHEVAVYYSQRSYALNCGAPIAVKDLTVNALLRGHVSFGFLWAERRRSLNTFRAVVLPMTECLDEPEAADLARYVERGGGLVIIGDGTGCFDAFRQPYGRNLLLDKLGVAAPERVSQWTLRKGKGRIAFLRELLPARGSIDELVRESLEQNQRFPMMNSNAWNLLKNRADLLKLVDWAADGLGFTTTLPDTVLVEQAEQAKTGHTLIHLVNFDLEHDVGPFEIVCARRRFRTVTCHSPDQRQTRARFLQAGRGTRLCADGFDRYCVMELS